jgi:hypothetical protein
MLAGAQNDWGYGKMHFVDESLSKVLANRSDSATKPDVFPICGFGGPSECVLDAISDEVERCATLHDDRTPRVVREYENRSVVRWIFAPPTFPTIVGPRSSDRPEHVAAQDPSSNIIESTNCKIVIDTDRAALFAMHLLKGPSRERPFEYRFSANAKWVVEILIRASAKAVD